MYSVFPVEMSAEWLVSPFPSRLNKCYVGLESQCKKRQKVTQLSQDPRKVASYFTISW